MLTRELKEQVEAEVRKYIDIANQKYRPPTPFTMPVVTFKLRGTTAGKAFTTKWTVAFNIVLLCENVADFLARTVPHEVAHLIDYKLSPQNHERSVASFMSSRSGRRRAAKRSLHGDSWRAVMYAFGVRDVTRCHKYDTTNSKVQKRRQRFQYSCKCPGKIINATLTVHTRIQNDQNLPESLQHKYRTRCCRHLMTANDFIARQVILPTKPAQAPLPPPSAPKTKTTAAGTKMHKAVEIVRRFSSTAHRSLVIGAIMQECSMSRAGAQTYYYNAVNALKGQW